MSVGDWIIICLIIGHFFWLKYKVRKSETRLVKTLQMHQNWLFNQLYTMAPGKVLRPDEEEDKEESAPAKVIHTSRDPMNEFNGKKSDWF